MLRNGWPWMLLALVVGVWAYTRFDDRSPRASPSTHHSDQGTLISLGNDAFHVEAIFDDAGKLWLYILGPDPSRVIDVEEQTLTAHVRSEGFPGGSTMTLTPLPREDDAAGRTSRFVGALPPEMVDKRLKVTIPLLRLGGQRFRLAFASPAATHETEMPRGASPEEERKLFLTPAGKYTRADIESNGRRLPSQVYPGFKANHDFNPRQGDFLCPVTRTKANPACTWVIDGKSYSFCCPPCIDEFVRLARESPERIHSPEAYRRP